MTNPLQGLRVLRNFSDILDREVAIDNLGLNSSDLDIIRGITEQGVTIFDFRTIANLEVDLEKEVLAIFNETNLYRRLLDSLVSSRYDLPVNLSLNGRAISQSFKYKKVDFEDSNNILTLDVSTSRASAWSSFGDSTQSVYYGNTVTVTPNNTVELASIEFYDSDLVEKRFDSQLPTHKIPISIDGVDYEVFAMKGNPLTFNGFFRSAQSLSVEYTSIQGTSINPSWVIYPIDGSESEVVYKNVGTGTQSNIFYYKNNAKSRNIEIYYPSSLLTAINLSGLNITRFPNVVLENLDELIINNNDFGEMIDLSGFTSLTVLDISNNNLQRSRDPALNSFSQEVVNRLPSSLRNLDVTGCYTGEVTADLSTLTSLVTFRAVNTLTNRNLTGESPAIPPSLINYSITNNRFVTLHSSVKDSTTLEDLQIRGNLIDETIYITSDQIKNVVTGGNNVHEIINLSGKTNLETYVTSNMTFPGTANAENVVSGCSNLNTFIISSTNATGAIPDFSSNTSLRIFSAADTKFTDAIPDFYSLGETTFAGCKDTLVYFVLSSPLLVNEMHPGCLLGLRNLQTFRFSSDGNGIPGTIPDLTECINLVNVLLDRNNLTGSIPSFAENTKLSIISLNSNNFSGDVPSLNLPLLNTLILSNNQLTNVLNLNCRNLRLVNFSNNLLASFPDFDSFNIPDMRTIIMENAFDPNEIIGYNEGTLDGLTELNRLRLVNCNLNQGVMNKIIRDLNENYNRNPRPGVTIELLGNSTPSQTDEILSIISRLRNNGWTIGI